MSDYPALCAFCQTLTPSRAALEAHLEAANHAADPAYPLFYARRRVDVAQEWVEIAQAALDAAHDNLARLEVSA